MSLAATRAVWQHSRQQGTALLVMLALADHADAQMVAWPSAQTLAAMARTTDRHARRILKDLVAAGEIEPVGTGIRGVVKYRLTPDTHVMGAAGPTPDTDVRGERAEPLTPMSGDAGVTPDTHVTPPLTPMSEDPLTPMSPEPSGNRQEPGGDGARAREGDPSATSSGDPDAQLVPSSNTTTTTPDAEQMRSRARALLQHWNAEIERLWGGDPSPRSQTNGYAVVSSWLREGVPDDIAMAVITDGLERRRQTGDGPPGGPSYVKHSIASAIKTYRQPLPEGAPNEPAARQPYPGRQPAQDPDVAAAARRRAALERHGLAGLEPGGAAAGGPDEGPVVEGTGHRIP